MTPASSRPHVGNSCSGFSTQVNVIPVIAKADIVSKNDLKILKRNIMNELLSYGVQIYQFPTEDEDVAEVNSAMNVSRKHKNECQFNLKFI